MKTNNILTFLLISIFILASCRDNKMLKFPTPN